MKYSVVIFAMTFCLNLGAMAGDFSRACNRDPLTPVLYELSLLNLQHVRDSEKNVKVLFANFQLQGPCSSKLSHYLANWSDYRGWTDYQAIRIEEAKTAHDEFYSCLKEKDTNSLCHWFEKVLQVESQIDELSINVTE